MGEDLSLHIKTDRDTVTILTGAIETPFKYKGFKYTLHTTDSLISLVKSKGGPNTVIGYTEEQIVAILDDTIQDRPKDTCTYSFKKTQEYEEWLNAIRSSMDQKTFIDFLKHRDPFEVEGLESLIATISQLKMVTIITGDYDYSDENNRTVLFKKQDGSESKVDIPERLNVDFPLIESGAPIKMVIELELIRPDSDQKRPMFVLKCPNMKRYWKSAVQAEIRRVKEEDLLGALVVAGAV
jgi:uncharacterized protein YfdQ (DUF2303 family)